MPRSSLSPAFSASSSPRSDADPYDHKVGLDPATPLQRYGFAINGNSLVFEVKVHAVLFVQRANEVAHVWAENALHRQLVRCHDMHSSLRARSEAATSSPMKLAPMTTTRPAALAPSMIAWQSASERSVRTCAWSAPGIVRRTGSAPVASNSLS
jgi:hypothetical protein